MNITGNGTIGVACIRANRKYVLIEKEQEYVDIIVERIDQENRQFKMF